MCCAIPPPRAGRGSAKRISWPYFACSCPHPAHATRTDYASARSSSAPVLNQSTNTLKVFASTSGMVTGSARLVADTLSHEGNPCTFNGAQHTEDRYTGTSGHFINTAGHPIVGHTNLTGRLTVA